MSLVEDPKNKVEQDEGADRKESAIEEAAAIATATLEINHKLERKLVRKLDIHIIPLVMLLYLFSFLDRVNIGNARLYSMEKDLGLVGQDFQTATSLVFVTYVLCETPSNMILKKFTPRIWIALITVLWGIIATLTGLVQNYGQLIACRLLLGMVEAGLFPGMTVYLTFFYTKREIGLRVAYLLVSAALAGGVGGLLAFGIGAMDGLRGLHGWRWIMIIEGIPTVLLGIFTFFWMPNDPDTAWFLHEEERALVQYRRATEYGQTESAQKFAMRDSMKAFKDWKVWVMSTGQFGIDTMLYGFSAFLPTIINGLGKYTSSQVQLLTIPCYATGAIVYMIYAYLSDHFQRRALFTIIAACQSIIGYAILISDAPTGPKYFGCFLVASGIYVCVGVPLAWMPNNNPRWGKRTTASGIQLTVGNCAGIMAPFIYPTAQGPRYVEGHAITLAMVGYAAVLYACLWVYFRWRNRQREMGKEDYKVEGLSEEEMMELGDESPRFRFTV